MQAKARIGTKASLQLAFLINLNACSGKRGAVDVRLRDRFLDGKKVSSSSSIMHKGITSSRRERKPMLGTEACWSWLARGSHVLSGRGGGECTRLAPRSVVPSAPSGPAKRPGLEDVGSSTVELTAKPPSD